MLIICNSSWPRGHSVFHAGFEPAISVLSPEGWDYKHAPPHSNNNLTFRKNLYIITGAIHAAINGADMLNIVDSNFVYNFTQ